MRVLVMTKDPGIQSFSEVTGYPEISSITGLVLSGLFGEGGCLFLLETKSGCLNRRKNCRCSVARSLGLGKAFQELQRSVKFQMSPEKMESQ